MAHHWKVNIWEGTNGVRFVGRIRIYLQKRRIYILPLDRKQGKVGRAFPTFATF